MFYIAFVRFDIEGLREQLFSLFFIDIVRRLVAESLIPWLKKTYRSHSLQKNYEQAMMTYEEELEKGAILETNKEEYEQFDDYLEIITNFGYLVMISSCFPMAPLLIFIAHQVEIWQDRYKIVHIFKRKLPQHYVGMGRWKTIIVFLCYVSIITVRVLLPRISCSSPSAPNKSPVYSPRCSRAGRTSSTGIRTLGPSSAGQPQAFSRRCSIWNYPLMLPPQLDGISTHSIKVKRWTTCLAWMSWGDWESWMSWEDWESWMSWEDWERFQLRTLLPKLTKSRIYRF